MSLDAEDSEYQEGDEMQDAVEDLSKAESSQSVKRIKRRGGNMSQSQEGGSQMSAAERKELERKRRERQKREREMRKYLEAEAELGSDNEENDDVAKAINRDGDEEEDEEGLDEDLKDFVVYEGDEQEVDDETAGLYEKY